MLELFKLNLVLGLLSKYTLSIINTLVFLNLFTILLVVSLLNTFLRLISVIISLPSLVYLTRSVSS
jgi:hypothetical protein